MNTNLCTIQSACLADWGPAIETAARHIAVAVAFTYALGFTLGTWVHRTNDRLARAYVALLGLAPTAVPVAPAVTPVAAPEAAPEAPVAVTPEAAPEAAPEAPVADLAALTVVELRKLARATLGSAARINGRRIAQATKASLLEALS